MFPRTTLSLLKADYGRLGRQLSGGTKDTIKSIIRDAGPLEVASFCRIILTGTIPNGVQKGIIGEVEDKTGRYLFRQEGSRWSAASVMYDFLRN